ncbi:MAG: tetratricopeptide repeat protein [Deltaproteobacteria bacterium]|nr:tetratricopeptide repeat protein [Deltaproteobacteria bacterium]
MKPMRKVWTGLSIGALFVSLAGCELDHGGLDAGVLAPSMPAPSRLAPSMESVQEQISLARVDELLAMKPVTRVEEEPEEVVEQNNLLHSLAFKHVDLEPVDHMVTAKSLLQTGDRAQAMLELEKAIYDNPRNYDAAMLLGKVARKSGDDDLATDAFLLSAEIDSTSDEPWVQLARLTLDRGQVDDSEQMLRRALTLNSDRAETYNLMGRVWLNRSHWQRAVLNFEKALSMRPESNYYRNNLGYAFLLMRDFNSAVKSLDPLAKREGARAFMLNNLGLAYEGVGRIHDAMVQYKKASVKNPDYLKSRINMERMVRVAKTATDVSLDSENGAAEEREKETGSDLILPEAGR